MDPVHLAEDGLWYFWDEVWANRMGPYNTKEECNVALIEYLKQL